MKIKNKPYLFYNGKHNNIVAKKSLGQNFLQAQWVVEDICKNVDIAGNIILEVGAGTGFLTREILKHNPRKMIIIEKDRRMIEILQNLCKELHCEGKVKIINGDALKYKITDVLNEAICGDSEYNDCQNIHNEKLTIIGNLPYNADEVGLKQWFEKNGLKDIEFDVRITLDKDTGKSRGFGFVSVFNKEDINDVIKLNGKQYNMRKLIINEAKK